MIDRGRSIFGFVDWCARLHCPLGGSAGMYRICVRNSACVVGLVKVCFVGLRPISKLTSLKPVEHARKALHTDDALRSKTSIERRYANVLFID